MRHVTCRISDLGCIDNIWSSNLNIGINTAIKRNEKVLYVLIHPRQWYSRIGSNIYENYIRLFEEIKLHI